LNGLGNFVKRTLVLGGALVAIVYAGDYVVVRLRVAYPGLGSAFGSVTMARVYAIPLKNGNIEYELDAATGGDRTLRAVAVSAPGIPAVLVFAAAESQTDSRGHTSFCAPVARHRASGLEAETCSQSALGVDDQRNVASAAPSNL
jgi:hypothetical protein